MKLQKVSVLYMGADRRCEWRKLILDGMGLIDEERCVGWRIRPSSRVPIGVENGRRRKTIKQGFIVTEWSADAYNPCNQYDGGSRSWEWRNAIMMLSNRIARTWSLNAVNYSLMAVLLLAAVLAVVAVVVLIKSDIGGIL